MSSMRAAPNELGHQLNLFSSAFLTMFHVVKMKESMMPATVKVPPTMAHTCKGKRYQVLLLGT